MLSNTTLGVLMATIDASIVLISLPDIFRGIQLNPLTPGNTSYFLWLLMGYMLVTAVLVVSFGRLGDMFGRVRMYNLGFVIFTVFSILLSVTWMHGPAAAIYMIVMRVFQGVGGALILANSAAIITDAFPRHQRGLALGINAVAAIAGSFIGLVLGGVLAPVDWRLVFWVSVPVGVAGSVWGYINLKDRGIRTPARIDWAGQRHLRRRADRGACRHRVRHRAARRARDGLDQPAGDRRTGRRCDAAGRVRLDRDRRSRRRCSASRCSGSGRSPPGTWPA